MNAELADVRDALVRLRGSVESLRSADGDSCYVRRLMNDLERFQLDMEDVAGTEPRVTAVRGSKATTAREVVPLHDGPYSHLSWPDADDEGIGGHRR
ncbi:hypothetical protein JS756_31360 [Streptomyces actuosus]|uniref:Uncharacterized protein n=1 Tax=Streptomyces actuosus TaxID=1885 RepID=A0ABS2VZR5_STRAS|nr:hypothetical protein [Streptomyces actuosus]MBN0048518.1 hypothetical protein [Streptomyces actuosus]